MDLQALEEVVDELVSSIEAVEAQATAAVQFLKAQGLATDEQLTPYMQQAGTASNVKWRAARLRLKRILSSAVKEEERSAKEAHGAAEKQQVAPGPAVDDKKQPDANAKAAQQAAELAKPQMTEDDDGKTRDEAPQAASQQDAAPQSREKLAASGAKIEVGSSQETPKKEAA